jgi:hypothetical protein
MKYFAFAIGLTIAYVLLTSAKRKSPLTKDGIGIARFLMGLGYSKSIASGIAGNIYVESKYDPLAVGDNGQSFGLAQWHKSRWDALKKWSENKNLNVASFEAQLKFIDWELNNTEKRAKTELMKTTKPEDSAFVFAKYYERPAFISNRRMTKAREIYDNI